jgi:hypothetical protein
LSLDCLRVHLNRPSRKLDADCGLGIQIEFISSESTQQVGLSDTGVSDQDD